MASIFRNQGPGPTSSMLVVTSPTPPPKVTKRWRSGKEGLQGLALSANDHLNVSQAFPWVGTGRPKIAILQLTLAEKQLWWRPGGGT